MRSLALALLALLALAAPAAAQSPVVGPLQAQLGIADQKPALFGDPRFRQLGVQHVRRAVAWDTFDHAWQVAEVDEYMVRARDAGLSPLIAFDRSRIEARRHATPSRAQLRALFAQFRQRYPWVTDYAVWNEPNIGGQWAFRKPEELGRIYRDMRAACPGCRILAADLVDTPNMVSWAKRLVKGAGTQPALWGVHNYLSANRFDASRTLSFLRAVRGDVWLTEVGGLVKRRSSSTTHIPEGVAHAGKVTTFIFDGLARLDRRIKRVYLYHWNEDPGTPSWDSGLIDAAGQARPAFGQVRPALTASRPARSGVVLGAGIGGVRLGMTKAQARRAGARGVKIGYRGGRVVRLETTSRAHRTPAGVAVGSTALQVATAHLSKRSAAACGRRSCVVGVPERGGVISELQLNGRKRVTRLVIRVV